MEVLSDLFLPLATVTWFHRLVIVVIPILRWKLKLELKLKVEEK
jgi:hypothetical protein